MRSGTIWHPRLVAIITALGHTETIVLADAGLAAPAGIEVVDLVWTRGEPPLLPVLNAVLAEMDVEQATIAEETRNPKLLAGMQEALDGRRTVAVPHDRLKQLSHGARAIIRTGECTPYANMILHAGVTF